MNYTSILSEKIQKKTAVVGIIGIGYVGEALAIGAARVGFQVFGFTRTDARVKKFDAFQMPNLTATTDISYLKQCDIVCICVPTPIFEDKSPDLGPFQNALHMAVSSLRKGSLVIIESTIAPGTTRDFALPILKSTGLSEDEFFLSFSPERVDPGNKKYNLYNTPKVVSGLDHDSQVLATLFFQHLVQTVIPVSSLEVAEMSKILENTFRLVNISLMNELLDYTNKLGINLWEVIAASSTKPFGFLPHYPGPGVGGHCIPVDPYYLLEDAAKRGISLEIVQRAGDINEKQPQKVVAKTLDILKQTNGKKRTHSALLIGLSYKENIEDKRESPSIKIWELLQKENLRLAYHDPFISTWNGYSSEQLSEATLKGKDIIIITTPHSAIDYSILVSLKKPILDTRNVLKDYSFPYIYRI